MFDDFTSCAVCQYNNGDKCELFGRVIGMNGCSSGVERKPRNNFEKIKAMSVEQFAKWIVTIEMRILKCNPMLERPALEEDWLDWLKKEES